MRRPRRPAQELRFAIECLPRRTREAMLEGIHSNSIIVGAYTDRRGGVCPMLAAHRRGGRTNLASFARAWDRYTGAKRGPRRATERELRTLASMLEGSLATDDRVQGELAAAITHLKTVKARQAGDGSREAAAPANKQAGEAAKPATEPPRGDTGERARFDELRARPGWAWLRLFRRYDDYEAALARVREAEDRVERRELERV